MKQELAIQLLQNRDTIVERWCEMVLDTYPKETSRFLATQKDPFRNPIGHAIDEALGPVYDQVTSTMDADAIWNALDGIIRIRSVQDFTPSQAVGFVFGLKRAIRETVDGRDGLAVIDSRIDRVAALAFDKYMECREKLYEIRLGEIKRTSVRNEYKAASPSANPQCNGGQCR